MRASTADDSILHSVTKTGTEQHGQAQPNTGGAFCYVTVTGQWSSPLPSSYLCSKSSMKRSESRVVGVKYSNTARFLLF